MAIAAGLCAVPMKEESRQSSMPKMGFLTEHQLPSGFGAHEHTYSGGCLQTTEEAMLTDSARLCKKSVNCGEGKGCDC